MAGLDTNLLVRLLVADDADQLARVQALIRTAQYQGAALFIPITVVLELEWVLRSRYGFAKDQIVAAMVGLLEARELAFQLEPAVEQALYIYSEHNADFADCLHAGLCSANGHAPLLTFDAKAARLAEVQLVNTMQ